MVMFVVLDVRGHHKVVHKDRRVYKLRRDLFLEKEHDSRLLSDQNVSSAPFPQGLNIF